MAPPPPGPTILKSPGRWAKAGAARATARDNRSKKRIMSELPAKELGVRMRFCQKGRSLSIDISGFSGIFLKINKKIFVDLPSSRFSLSGWQV